MTEDILLKRLTSSPVDAKMSFYVEYHIMVGGESKSINEIAILSSFMAFEKTGYWPWEYFPIASIKRDFWLPKDDFLEYYAWWKSEKENKLSGT